MQNKFIGNISTSVKILIQLMLIVILLIAKSIYLILFITVLVLILLILSNINVKVYIKSLKNSFIWLLFFVLVYIIVFRNIFVALILTYKLILVILILKSFLVTTNFNKLSDGIYTLIYPLKRTKLNIENLSYKISISLFYIIYYLDSKSKIRSLKKICVNKGLYYKNYLVSRVFIAVDDINNLEFQLKLKFYSPKKEKLNFKSYLLLFLFSLLFITAIFKEVVF